MTPRLPVPGSDDGQWGELLNDFLDVEHNSDGTLRPTGSLANKYTLPTGGIPYEDLSSGVQAILNNTSSGNVSSVNNQTGVVVLNADDIDDASTVNKFVSASQLTKIDSVETGATADQTPTEILNDIKTVDGTGSGLDADLLDGQNSTDFATSAQGTLADTATQPGDNVSSLTNDAGYLTTVPVTSVNAQTGAVSLNADNIDDTTTANKFVTANDLTKLSNTTGVNTGDQDLSNLVTKITTINGHDLSSNVVITKGDLGLGNIDNTADINKPVSSAIQTALNDKVDASSLGTSSVLDAGVANGTATLDGGGKVPVSQLPSSVMKYKGTWSALANTPTIANGVGDAGDVYRVTAAGDQDLGSGSIHFGSGDWVIYNGSAWQQSNNSDEVTSVIGKTGAVTINADEIDDSTTTNKFTNATNLAKLAGIENNADVTSATNVEAAGAVMVATIGTLVMAYSTGLQQIAGLTNPAADRILFWDNSASSYAYLTVSTGLTVSGTSLSVNSSSTAQAGIIQTATTTEATAGADASKAVTSQGVQTFWNDRFINESTMASNSATKAPSQQSVKAYIASSATTVNGRSGAVTLSSSDVGITISTNAPSGGANGDIWLEY